MIIGPHMGKSSDLSLQRQYVLQLGYDCFQTHFGNPQSYDIPADMPKKQLTVDRTPLWILHAAFVSSVNPAERIRDGCAIYLKNVIRIADYLNIHAIVVHTGAVSGIIVDNVMSGMISFFNDYKIVQALEKTSVKLAVEFGASTCGFNIYPEVFASYFSQHPHIGYCLDLAHQYAAGCSWASLRRMISNYGPPIVCHCNFPGSHFGSSHDIHGWRMAPQHVMNKRKLEQRSLAGTASLVYEWDTTVKQLAAAAGAGAVPMIVEGGGLPDGDIAAEIATIRRIIDVNETE